MTGDRLTSHVMVWHDPRIISRYRKTNKCKALGEAGERETEQTTYIEKFSHLLGIRRDDRHRWLSAGCPRYG